MLWDLHQQCQGPHLGSGLKTAKTPGCGGSFHSSLIRSSHPRGAGSLLQAVWAQSQLCFKLIKRTSLGKYPPSARVGAHNLALGLPV